VSNVIDSAARGPRGGGRRKAAGLSAALRIVLPALVAVLGIAALQCAPCAQAAATMAAWGENRDWQLGAGYKSQYSMVPVPVAGGVGEVTQMVAGFHFTLVLLSDGTVRAWGGNCYGQLGDGSRMDSAEPVSPVGLSGVTAIAAAGAHAMALLDDGTVVTWGGDLFGQLGNGTTSKGRETGSSSTVPVHVPGLSGVVAIAAGGADDFALLGNGTVMAWGENRDGQIGDGTTAEKDVPTPVRGLSGVRAISAGGLSSVTGHVLALLDNGTVMGWGRDGLGQVGYGAASNRSVTSPVAVKGLSSVVAVSAGATHSLALLSNGTVMAWGSNAHGQLGLGPGPEVCGGRATACSTIPRPVGGLRDVTAVSAGFGYSLAVSGGTVEAWGKNKWGNLGDGTLAERDLPTPVDGLNGATAVNAGEQHSLALLGGAAPFAGGPAPGGEPVPPPVKLTPGAGSLTVSWEAPAGPGNWVLRWRERSSPQAKWSKYVTLAPETRSYTVTGLEAKQYEVLVKNKAFGAKFVVGTPLQAPAPAPAGASAEPPAPEQPPGTPPAKKKHAAKTHREAPAPAPESPVETTPPGTAPGHGKKAKAEAWPDAGARRSACKGPVYDAVR
jgi:alpha-tubulin suppressor-like RCC1 family protein